MIYPRFQQSRFFCAASLLSLALMLPLSPVFGASTPDPSPYGNNSKAGAYVAVNGIKMYYEEYGRGDPLVLIHGNGQSIAAMNHQIEYFAADRRVIVADSRAHGNSGLGEGTLNYPQMARDWAALLTHLGVTGADVIGWSDGGNIGLLLAIHNPDKIKKLAVMGANLQPDESAVYPWAVAWVAAESKRIDEMLAAGDTSQNWALLQQHFTLLREQPDIKVEQLGQIAAPVLVMSGDRDVIRLQHTMLMFRSIPQSQLVIFPGETHFTPANDPVLFNATTAKFFNSPFSMPDTKDLF